MKNKLTLDDALKQIDKLKKENTKLKEKNRSLKKYKEKADNLKTQLELIIDGAALGIWDQDFLTGEVIRNDKWAEQLGYTAEELESDFLQFKNLVHPDDFQNVLIAEREHLSGRNPIFRAEHRMKAKNGEWKWILNIGKVIKKDKYGNPLRAVGTHLDITDIKHTQERLKRSEQRFKNLFDYAPIGLWEQDVSDLIKYISYQKSNGVKNFKKFFDNNPDELIKCTTKIKPLRINKAALDIHEAKSLNEIKNYIDKIFTKKSLEVFKNQIIAYSEGAYTFESDTETKTLKGKIKKLKIYISFKMQPLEKRNVILFSIVDITKQKIAEKKLIESEQKYKSLSFLFRNMADNLSDMLWAKDLNNKYIFVNKGICKNLLNAKNTNEPIGKDDLFFAKRERDLHPKNKKYHTFGEICLKSDEIVLKSQKAGRFDEFGNVKGKFLFLDVQKAPLYNNDGKLIGTVGSARDITKEKEIEKALKESENKYKTLFEFSPTGITLLDKTGKILNANPEFHKLFGYSVGELIGENISKISHPNSHEFITENINRILKGETLIHVLKGITKSGRLNYIELYETSIRLSKRKKVVLSISKDITERVIAENKLRESEKHFRTLFNNNPVPMYIYDIKSLKFLEVNKAMIKNYGYTQKELLNMTKLDIEEGSVEKKLLDFHNSKGINKKIEGVWKHRKKNGEVISAATSEHNINYFGTKGKLVIAKDITQSMKYQKELAESQKQIRMFAEHLENIREEQRADIAREIHDNLGQSLTAIKIDLSSLERKSKIKDAKFSEKLKSTKRLIDESIETVQKISTSLRPVIIDDLGLAAAIEWQISEFSKRTNIKTNLNISPKNLKLENNLSVNIFRIIQESLTNISRHANASLVNISLKVNKSILELKIKDNGIGIREDKIKNLKSFGIMGIQERVISFGGKLIIRGNKNKGTYILITIPLTREHLI